MSVSQKKTRQHRLVTSRSSDQPATRKMLSLVRDELKSDIRSLELKIEGRFSAVDSRLSRMELLLEEQNANNRIVLEGLQALWSRQDKIESQISV